MMQVDPIKSNNAVRPLDKTGKKASVTKEKAEDTNEAQAINTQANAPLLREVALALNPQVSFSISNTSVVTDKTTTLNPKGNFIILVTGPYGVGKDSLISKVLSERNLKVSVPVRYTTRAKREKEVDGKDYYFISTDEFLKMKAIGEFLLGEPLETGDYYGTSIKSVQDSFDERKTPILIEGDDEIEPMKRELNQRNISFIELFISPISKQDLTKEGGIDKALEILKGRMEKRGTSKIDLRLQKSRKILENIPPSAQVIANEDGKLNDAIVSFSKVIRDKLETTPTLNVDYLFKLPGEELPPCFEGKGELIPKGNFVVIITGLFAGGKNSVVDSALKQNQKLQQIVEHTSRTQRAGEINGKEYFFTSKEEFERMVKNNELLVWFEWGGETKEYYGYSVGEIQKAFDNGKTPILIQGPTNSGPMRSALNKRNIPNLVTFISPHSREELKKEGGVESALKIIEKRMEGTGRNKVERRLLLSKAMLESLPEDIYVVKNENGGLETATADFLNLITQKKIKLLASLQDSELAKLSPQLLFSKSGETPDVNLNTEKFKANKNIAIILTGPSGAGKGTLIEYLSKKGLLNITEALSHTTRPVGKNEINGKDYFFVNRNEFIEMIAKNNLAEWVMVHNGYFFGKSADHLQENLDSGKDIVFALNVSGANYYKKLFTKLGIPYIDVFLSPVPKDLLASSEGIDKATEILRKRIETRNRGETEAQIEERMRIAREWLSVAKDYTHIIENTEGNLEKAASDFTNIVQTKKAEAYKIAKKDS